ncbi:hypothetical protein P4J20_31090 [Bacillus cereus]|nr:hypothetical protein [Bacillus cereus]
MCNSQSSSNACCPAPQIIQEKICGNFSTTTDPISVWTATDNSYISGTFEVFNSDSTPGNATFDVVANPDVGPIPVLPGTTMSVSVRRPTGLIVHAPLAGASGTYCLTLYKRVLA